MPHQFINDPLVNPGGGKVRREVAAEDVPLRPLDARDECLPSLAVGQHDVPEKPGNQGIFAPVLEEAGH
jgi:hypothetical protein